MFPWVPPLPVVVAVEPAGPLVQVVAVELAELLAQGQALVLPVVVELVPEEALVSGQVPPLAWAFHQSLSWNQSV